MQAALGRLFEKMFIEFAKKTASGSLQVKLLEAGGVVVAREWLPGSCSRPAAAQLLGCHMLEAADVSADESIASQAVCQHVLCRTP